MSFCYRILTGYSALTIGLLLPGCGGGDSNSPDSTTGADVTASSDAPAGLDVRTFPDGAVEPDGRILGDLGQSDMLGDPSGDIVDLHLADATFLDVWDPDSLLDIALSDWTNWDSPQDTIALDGWSPDGYSAESWMTADWVNIASDGYTWDGYAWDGYNWDGYNWDGYNWDGYSWDGNDWDFGSIDFGPLPDGGGGGCGGLDPAGVCEGNVLKYCMFDTLFEQDCSEFGPGCTCAWSPVYEWFDCIGNCW